MRFRELVLSDASGGEGLRLGVPPAADRRWPACPAPARRELVETLITASAGGRADRALTTDDGPADGVARHARPGADRRRRWSRSSPGSTAAWWRSTSTTRGSPTTGPPPGSRR